MLYATNLVTFHRKLEATSCLQLMQIRLAYTLNIDHKQHVLGEGKHGFIEIAGVINPSVREM